MPKLMFLLEIIPDQLETDGSSSKSAFCHVTMMTLEPLEMFFFLHNSSDSKCVCDVTNFEPFNFSNIYDY